MIKISKAKSSELKLTTNEALVLNALGDKPVRLVDIETKINLPHSSVFDTLQSLENRKLAVSIFVGKRKMWKMSIDSNTSNQTQTLPKDVEVYIGKQEVLAHIYELFEKNKNKRVLVYHGPKAFAEWYKVLDEEDIVDFNLLIQKMNIIIERFVPKKDFNEYMRKVSTDYAKSMLNRSQITYLLPDELFNSKTELMLFESNVVMYESHVPRLVVLKDIETIKMYKNIFEVFRSIGVKIDSQKEFLKCFKKEKPPEP